MDVDGEGTPQERMLRTKRSLQKWKSFPNRASSFKRSKTKKWSKDNDADILHLNGNPLPKLAEEEEAVGIITMEDVIEELLQVSDVSIRVTKSKSKHSLFHLTVYIFLWVCGYRKRSLMKRITILKTRDSG